MKKMFFTLSALIISLFMISLASASQKAGRIYQVQVVEPNKIINQKYIVKKGDTLSGICYRFLGNARKQTYSAIAALNGITHEKLWVFPEQKLVIPVPLVLKQTQLNQNPTVLPLEKVVKLSVNQLKTSLEQIQIDINIFDGFSEKIITGLTNSQEQHCLNNQTVATVSFGQGVQGWTRVEVGENFCGKTTIVNLPKEYLVRATWTKEQCNNLYLQLLREKLQRKAFLLPSPPKLETPPELPPPPPVLKAELQKLIIAQYDMVRAKYRWDWDSTWGYFDERYDDGNKVHGWWQSSTLYPIVFDDSSGNKWAFGLNYTTRGDWSGETGEDPPFNYKGEVKLWQLAGRFRDADNNWELIGRAGSGERKDSGYLVNEWGRYEMEQETKVFNIYSSAEYNGRKDNAWFSKIRFSLEGEKDVGHEKRDYWIDQWNGRQVLNGQPDKKDMFTSALYLDIFNLYKKDIQVWGEGRTTYDWEGPRWYNVGKLGLSFLNGSFKIGVGTGFVDNWHKNDNPKMGKTRTSFYGRPYAELSLYNLYHYFVGYEEEDAWDFSREVEGAGYQSIIDNFSDKPDIWDFNKKTENSGY